MEWRGGIIIEGDDSDNDGAAGFDEKPRRDKDNEVVGLDSGPGAGQVPVSVLMASTELHHHLQGTGKNKCRDSGPI